jgi:hypothetical protein
MTLGEQATVNVDRYLAVDIGLFIFKQAHPLPGLGKAQVLIS